MRALDIKMILAAIGGGVGHFLGGYDGFIVALAVFTVADYITGVMCAIVDKNLSSEIGAKGIFKKILIFVMVGIAHMVDTHFIGDGGVVRTAAIFFYASNEGISLLENASKLGLPVPQKLKDVLSQLDKGGKSNDNKQKDMSSGIKKQSE